jgi:hypothetical protein
MDTQKQLNVPLQVKISRRTEKLTCYGIGIDSCQGGGWQRDPVARKPQFDDCPWRDALPSKYFSDRTSAPRLIDKFELHCLRKVPAARE